MLIGQYEILIDVLEFECSYWVTLYPAGQGNRSRIINTYHSARSVKHFELN